MGVKEDECKGGHPVLDALCSPNVSHSLPIHALAHAVLATWTVPSPGEQNTRSKSHHLCKASRDPSLCP